MAYESDHSTEAMIEWLKENDPEAYDRLVEMVQRIMDKVVPVIIDMFDKIVEWVSGYNFSELLERMTQEIDEILRASRREKLRPSKYIRPTKTYVFDKRRLIRTYRQGD